MKRMSIESRNKWITEHSNMVEDYAAELHEYVNDKMELEDLFQQGYVIALETISEVIQEEDITSYNGLINLAIYTGLLEYANKYVKSLQNRIEFIKDDTERKILGVGYRQLTEMACPDKQQINDIEEHFLPLYEEQTIGIRRIIEQSITNGNIKESEIAIEFGVSSEEVREVKREIRDEIQMKGILRNLRQ